MSRKLIPLAQSIELPPPTPTMKSISCCRAKSTAGSTCRLVGFSSTPSKTKTSSPASRSDCAAALRMAGCFEARVGDQQDATAAQLAHQLAEARQRAPAPKTTRVGGWKSNGSRSQRAGSRCSPDSAGRRRRARRVTHRFIALQISHHVLVELERPGPEQEIDDAALRAAAAS